MSLQQAVAGDAQASPVVRRQMFQQAGKIAAAVAVTAAAGAITSAPAEAQITDVDIFNFALNFEYLGAEFYLRAVTGAGLAGLINSVPVPSGPGTPGTVLAPPNTLVPFQTPAVAYYAQRLANDELAHSRFIRDVLGSAAIPEPTIDLVTSWTTMAIAAGLIAPGQTFSPFASEVDFLLGAYILEDVCVTALAGAASQLTSPTNLTYAAGLLGTEGAHAGAIRGYLANIGGGAATDAISALRAKLSGVGDNGTAANGNPFNFTNVDFNGQSFRRTPQQVLAIAYGGNRTGGGFFPNGVNGTIVTSS